MVIFNSYVKLPEGIDPNEISRVMIPIPAWSSLKMNLLGALISGLYFTIVAGLIPTCEGSEY